MTFIQQFDQHRVINLAHRADRRQEVRQEFASQGMASYPNFYLATKPTEMPEGWVSLGTFGCFMSHLNVLREFLASKDETLLVLEDDIKFVNNPNALIQFLPEAWDIAYFGALNIEAPKGQGPFAVLSPTQMVMGAHCYAVNRKGAEAIVAFCERALTLPDGHPLGGPQHYDGAISMCRGQNHNLVTVIASPFVASQRASATDIHENRITKLDRLPVIGFALKMMRRVKNKLAA